MQLSGTLLTKATIANSVLIDSNRANELRRLRGKIVGRPPYAGVTLFSRNELIWIMLEEGWSGEPAVPNNMKADLEEVILDNVDLAGADLTGARLDGATLLPKSEADRLSAVLTSRQGQSIPLDGVEIQNRNELLWVTREMKWSGDPNPGTSKRPDFRGTNFKKARLQCSDLEGARNGKGAVR